MTTHHFESLEAHIFDQAKAMVEEAKTIMEDQAKAIVEERKQQTQSQVKLLEKILGVMGGTRQHKQKFTFGNCLMNLGGSTLRILMKLVSFTPHICKLTIL